MLSISKLGKGAEGYYLQAVASGVEGYYLGSGEAPGRWIGSGSMRLGLSGNVAADDLRAVLDGRCPVSGRSLIGSAARPEYRQRHALKCARAAPSAGVASRRVRLKRSAVTPREAVTMVGWSSPAAPSRWGCRR
jgi:hypothetical protein